MNKVQWMVVIAHMNGIAKMEDGANNGLKVIGFLNKFVAKV
jgi:hypothetical protein